MYKNMRYHNYDNFLHFDKDLGGIGQGLIIFVMIFVNRIFIEKRERKKKRQFKEEGKLKLKII